MEKLAVERFGKSSDMSGLAEGLLGANGATGVEFIGTGAGARVMIGAANGVGFIGTDGATVVTVRGAATSGDDARAGANVRFGMRSDMHQLRGR